MSAKGYVQMPILTVAAVTGVCNIRNTTVLVPSSAKKLRTNMQRPKVLLQLPKLHLKLLLLVLYVLMGIVSGQSATELPKFCFLKSPTNCHGKWHEMTRQTGAANPLDGGDVGSNASPYFVNDDNDGGVSPITEAVLFPSVQEFECPASSFDAGHWCFANIEPFLKYEVICPAAAAAADHTRSLLDAISVFVNNRKVQWHGDVDIVA
ncbi:MAG: hypothetical protein VW270_13900, partial [Candidatus Poseidoniales archaeon]